MNKGSGNDDTGTELSEYGEDGMLWRDIRGDEDGRKDADRAGRQHDEQQANAEADVVVPVDAGTAVSSLTVPACAVPGQVSIMDTTTAIRRPTQHQHGSGSSGQQMSPRRDRHAPPLPGGSRPPPRWGRNKSWRQLETVCEGRTWSTYVSGSWAWHPVYAGGIS